MDAIANRAYAPNPLAWAYRAAPQNLLDFAFNLKKINTKYKSLGYGLGALAGARRPPYLP